MTIRGRQYRMQRLSLGVLLVLSGCLSIGNPQSGQTVRGTITITVLKAHPDVVFDNDKVSFLIDGVERGTKVGSPYTYAWDTTTISDGPHQLNSKAFIPPKHTPVTSGTVNVTVDNTPPAGSLIIAVGAEATKTPTVLLSLSAADALSAVTTMRFSNDGVSYSPREAYATAKTWTLLSGDGLKTVFVQFRDAAGNWSVVPASDTIILDTTNPTVRITSPVDGTIITDP